MNGLKNDDEFIELWQSANGRLKVYLKLFFVRFLSAFLIFSLLLIIILIGYYTLTNTDNQANNIWQNINLYKYLKFWPLAAIAAIFWAIFSIFNFIAKCNDRYTKLVASEERDKNFIAFWEKNRNNPKYFTGTLISSMLSSFAYFLFILIIFITVFNVSDGFHEKIKLKPENKSLVFWMLGGMLIFTIGFGYIKAYFAKEMNENRYQEIKSKQRIN